MTSAASPVCEIASLLAGLSTGLADRTSREEQATRLAEGVVRAFRVDACVIRVLDGEDAVLLGASGIPKSALRERFPAVEGIGQLLIKSKRAAAIPELQGHPILKRLPKLPPAYAFRSYAGAPMLVGSEVIGIMGIYVTEVPRDFSDRELLQLQAIADHVAVVLENDRLYREVERQRESLRVRIEDLERAQGQIKDLNRLLEQRVEEQTDEMLRYQRELQELCYHISHELRAPLRSINGFSLRIMEDLGETLDAIHLDALERVREASVRMGGLIDDLLQLYRVSRADLSPVAIDLARMVDDIAATVLDRDGVDLRIESGLRVWADRAMVQVLIRHLLDNAQKFSSQSVRPYVEVGRREDAFFIRDNGIGFDMRFAERIFAPFERLNRLEYGGRGAGLAIARRVVERHGGAIWAESEPGQGAIFYFTLPSPA